MRTTLTSTLQERGAVHFPENTGERVYMREFTKTGGLPFDLRRWQPTVDAMLAGVDAVGPVFIMIDQGLVRAGTPQRRPGLHIDGYWVPSLQAHGGGGGGHVGCASGWDTGNRWKQCDFSAPEALILASDVSASRALVGDYTGEPGEGGDFSHLGTAGLCEIKLQAGRVYAGNVTMLHESLPVERDTLRTLVRLSVPGWTP